MDASRNLARRGRESKYPIVVYRDGEPLKELQDHYKPNAEGEQIIEVLILPDFMSKDNKRVKSRQIWGDLVYTPDSDLVAVLMHLGYFAHNLSHPPNTVVEVRVLVKLLPPQSSYPSKARFVKSRAWSTATEGCSYQVDKVHLITRTGVAVELAPCIDELPATQATVQPQPSDRQALNTRGTGTKGAKASQEVSVQFNLVNEPWLRYSLGAVADKGLKHTQLTSARLRSEALLLESASQRYQIAIQPAAGGAQGDAGQDVFTFARCKQLLTATMMAKKAGVPMPAPMLEVIETNVEWEEFKWGVSTLCLRGKEYPLKRLHFMRHCKPEDPMVS
mmetsp:Transcript_27769/g.70787  ORF Transcript_27769/g.70787 Transcript_27769/m.70787 type:complete len:333 (-) Transcript_27769:359-1357(-)|eukprot:CAMPEP_0202866690 /NCGR_PEP_ID=MMETSP1391-20130828/8305_1 /ASSEMBLY_ACC=CAM_ASM_000867 /TAXON_ID=1034604 /ORGANISM="Chlamydomonas leiostraca, Strain SAG 11-49" /LENGTH=332 /DNA_ID=CAMNT_0049546663 /DNA_START=202 /DNA_END=1200 /DNA_ORIENTATION=+